MADKSVGELIAAQSVTPTDLFVLEQNGTAKKLTGQILENWLVSFAVPFCSRTNRSVGVTD